MKTFFAAVIFSLVFGLSATAQSLSTAPDQTLYAAHKDAAAFEQYDQNGILIRKILTEQKVRTIAADPNGNAYYTQGEGNLIMMVDGEGQSREVAFLNGYARTMSVAGNGEIYVNIDQNHHGTDEISVNINQSHMTAGDQIAVNINQSHRIAHLSAEGHLLDEFEVPGGALAIAETESYGIILAVSNSSQVFLFDGDGNQLAGWDLPAKAHALTLSAQGTVTVAFSESSQTATYDAQGIFLRGSQFSNQPLAMASAQGITFHYQNADHAIVDQDGNQTQINRYRIAATDETGLITGEFLRK